MGEGVRGCGNGSATSRVGSWGRCGTFGHRKFRLQPVHLSKRFTAPAQRRWRTPPVRICPRPLRPPQPRQQRPKRPRGCRGFSIKASTLRVAGVSGSGVEWARGGSRDAAIIGTGAGVGTGPQPRLLLFHHLQRFPPPLPPPLFFAWRETLCTAGSMRGLVEQGRSAGSGNGVGVGAGVGAAVRIPLPPAPILRGPVRGAGLGLGPPPSVPPPPAPSPSYQSPAMNWWPGPPGLRNLPGSISTPHSSKKSLRES